MPDTQFALAASAPSGMATQTDNFYRSLVKAGDSDSHFVAVAMLPDNFTDTYAVVCEVVDEDTLNVGTPAVLTDTPEFFSLVVVPVIGTNKFVVLEASTNPQRYRVLTRTGTSIAWGAVQNLPGVGALEQISAMCALASTLMFATGIGDGGGEEWWTFSFDGTSLTLIGNADASFTIGFQMPSQLRRIDATHALGVWTISFAPGQGARVFEVTGGGAGVTIGAATTWPTPADADGHTFQTVADDLLNGRIWVRDPHGTNPLHLVPYTFAANALVEGSPVTLSQAIGQHWADVWVTPDGAQLMTLQGKGVGTAGTQGAAGVALSDGEVLVLGGSEGDKRGSYWEDSDTPGAQIVPALDAHLLEISPDYDTFRLWGSSTPEPVYVSAPSEPALLAGMLQARIVTRGGADAAS